VRPFHGVDVRLYAIDSRRISFLNRVLSFFVQYMLVIIKPYERRRTEEGQYCITLLYHCKIITL
jgi:hypothetical protein